VRVKVRFFAGIREAVGRPEMQVEVADGATAEDVWRTVAAAHPALAARRRSLKAAVNRRYAAFDAALGDGDEIVFIPPVSGG
jgi:molybdopterin converting factor subunit 1